MDLLQAIMRRGLELVTKRYYGLYRGTVVDVKDTEKRGRIRVHVPDIMDTDTQPHDDYWFEPAMMGAGGGRGVFWPPEIGDSVRVSFDEGDPNSPGIYIGGWFGAPNDTTEVPSAFKPGDDGQPEKRGFSTPGGHVFVMDDTPDKEGIRLMWQKRDASDPSRKDRSKAPTLNTKMVGILAFMKDGSFVVTTPSGSAFHIDDTGKSVKLVRNTGSKTSSLTLSDKGFMLLAPDGSYLSCEDGEFSVNAKGNISLLTGKNILLKANVWLGALASQSVLLGEATLAWLASHVHTSGPPGSPTSPPVTAATLPALVSKGAKVG